MRNVQRLGPESDDKAHLPFILSSSFQMGHDVLVERSEHSERRRAERVDKPGTSVVLHSVSDIHVDGLGAGANAEEGEFGWEGHSAPVCDSIEENTAGDGFIKVGSALVCHDARPFGHCGCNQADPS